MLRHFSWTAVGFLIAWQFACSGATFRQSSNSGSSSTQSANISISPASALVGSPDLTLTILGSNKFTFFNGHWHSAVLWSQDGVETALLTSFVNSSQLTAVVPAALLGSAGKGTVRVEIWDSIENSLVATSSLVPFPVTSSPPATPVPSISAISPSTVPAGSPDVTLTIDGSNFGHYGHFAWSTAFWTADANLHDHGTMLQTTIVNSAQVTAVIPAALLQSPTSVQILIMNGDVMGMSDGYFGYPRSNSVTFTVGP
jgi:IPT/TIG domain-containing protein